MTDPLIVMPPGDSFGPHKPTGEEWQIIEKIHKQARYRETLSRLDNRMIANALLAFSDQLQPLTDDVALLQEAATRLKKIPG